MADAEPPRPPELSDYAVVVRLPIQWGDQDAFGHVNNTVPIRWFESARIAYLERIGVREKGAQEGLGPILAMVSCNYRRQLHYPDSVRIGARITKIGRSSMTMLHVVYSEQLQAIAADGESVIVMFNYATNRSHPVPDTVRHKIDQIELRSGD